MEIDDKKEKKIIEEIYVQKIRDIVLSPEFIAKNFVSEITSK